MSRYNIAHKLGSKPRTEDVLLPKGENVDFSSMLLPQNILQGLHSSGFVKPSPIQLKAIPLARCGFDLIVQAKSGTGKTCVFAVTALEHVKMSSNRLQAIILAPTREIAQQIQHVISSVGCYLKSLKVKTFIGGVPLQEDKVNLVNCQIAVGAPGRLRHLIEEGYLSTGAVRLVVLDEADKLMEETFQNDINFIFQKLPESKQVIACSATYTQDLLNFLGNYMQSATHVTPGQDPSPILIGLKHFVCIQPASRNNLSKLKSKEACLMNILKNVSFIQCLVFSNYHSRAESICNGLLRNGWTALWIAGKQNQTTRTAVMTNVKDLKVRILVTTDLTARGIDLHEVNLVINMDLPTDHQTYLHRMGRAGRYGGHGLVITIITEDEVHKFQRLLGAIEGSYASAYIIPDSKPSDNIWTNDVLKFEKIIGVMDNTAQNCEKDDDIDGDEGEKFSGSGDSDSVVENKDCRNESFIKLEDDALNEGNVYKKVAIDDHYLGEGTSVKIEGESVGDSTKNNSIDNENFSHGSDKNKVKSLRNSSVDNNDSADKDKDPEKFSDSDDSESLNDNQNDDQIDSDHEYSDAISKFGLKLLNHTNNYMSNLSSYLDLDESLCKFIECKRQVDDSIPKKLLEPSGTVDFEYVSKFTEKLNFDMKKLLSVTNDLDSEKIVNWLMNDVTGDCLSKVFDNSKIKGNDNNKDTKEIRDPEYYSQSSSSSMSSDDDSDDYDIGTNKELSFCDKLLTMNKVKSVNKEIQMECKETESELNNICIDSSYGVDLIESSGKGTEKKGNRENIKELVGEKTVLFLRKSKGDRKRKQTHNLSSSSSQSSNEIEPNSRTTKEKIDSNKNLKKGKSNVITNKNVVKFCDESNVPAGKKTQDFNKLQSPEKNQANLGEKFSRISFKSNEVSYNKDNQLDDDDEDDEDMEDDEEGFYRRNNNRQNSNICANYYQGNVQEPQYYSPSANNNMNNMPNKVQEWYNLWYRQNANLRWYAGYNQYMNYMLNLKK